MTTPVGSDVAATARSGGDTAGGKLRAAREAAGLTIDAVAQQLKLAPRQVRALEDDAWERLPGRTFVRGFARNYARFVRLDPDAVLALLPAADAAPALERPALAASRRPMGEIPVERIAKRSPVRWLIALLLLAGIAAFAYYEAGHVALQWPFPRGASMSPPAANSEAGLTSAAPAAPRERGTLTTTLPNPVADATSAATTEPKDARSPAPTDGAAPPAATPSPAAPPLPATAAQRGSSAADSEAATATAEAALVLTFKGTSWAEVKDARGRVILQMTGGAGMTQTVSGVPPLELALGNAPEVAVTFRGQALDLAPYLRGNVARVALK